MQSRWDDHEAASYRGDLAQRVYTSRLLGQEKSLVLHGGGNTSAKITETDLFGEPEEILYVKGSGWDLATIEEAGFSPVRMAPLLRLAQLERLSDAAMVNALRCSMTNAGAPTPSVEAILHAIIPHRYVDHTHADAVIAVTNTPHGRECVREIYGDAVVIIPYVMPGFDLACRCAEILAAEPLDGRIGLILMNHGVFSFGETAKSAYERMIDLVSRAEQYLAHRHAWQIAVPEGAGMPQPCRRELARLRAEVSRTAGFPVVMTTENEGLGDPGDRDDGRPPPRSPAAARLKALLPRLPVREFVRRDDLAILSQQGPATPDHVIRTKRLPLVGRDVDAYAAAYREYFGEQSRHAAQPLTMLDPAPRVILDPELGMCAVGRSASEAAIVRDIYRQTMEIILRATALGGYQALPAREIFAVEYWELEQAKLRKQGKPPTFAGEVALVTGAAAGIGQACVDALLARGAAVVGLDLNPEVRQMRERVDFLGLQGDVADEAFLQEALDAAVQRFGGLDMLILNAGIFPPGCRIESLSLSEWDRVMRVNLDANLALMREAHPLLKLAPAGGRVVVIGSKNVPAPGPGAAAYSASKAALSQLARVAALEWGADGIRVNVLHPNAVFDTDLWTEEVLQARAASYNMSVAEYKTNNLLRREVTRRDVAELAAELCGPLFAKTTGAQIPVDGGNERVI
jgi:rhamnose utilization protein RhaD (predicted bifunctional aldolase and dehydrogenase)/NAD(P)-dependent dehydrogenase (short-subunit alcohol dehydrogenase family)